MEYPSKIPLKFGSASKSAWETSQFKVFSLVEPRTGITQKSTSSGTSKTLENCILFSAQLEVQRPFTLANYAIKGN
jgi:hypothetical protein